jgi:hypothetical protein
MELAKRLRKGVRAGGLANAQTGADNPYQSGLDQEVLAVIADFA